MTNKQLISDNIKSLFVEKWQEVVAELKDPEDVREVKALAEKYARWAVTGETEILENYEIAGKALACRLARKKADIVWEQFKDALWKAWPHILGYALLLLGV